jgi:D-alanine-D-alanine ligase-like ATP-grasp enzyme
MINCCTSVPNLKQCFELFGFDIIVDAHGKPWLLEVNSSPAFSNDCKIDEILKPRLIKEMIGLLDLK